MAEFPGTGQVGNPKSLHPRRKLLATILVPILVCALVGIGVAVLSVWKSSRDEEFLKSLLLAEEFEKFPDLLRYSPDGKVILKESYEGSLQASSSKREQRFQEIVEGYSPVECWAIGFHTYDIWRLNAVVPERRASVLAQTDDNSPLTESVFQFENPGAPREVLAEVKKRLGRCTEFSRSNEMGTFVQTVMDRTSDFQLPGTVVFSDDHDGWVAYSVAGELLMTFTIRDGSAVDSASLITSAVNKFHDGSKL